MYRPRPLIFLPLALAALLPGLAAAQSETLLGRSFAISSMSAEVGGDGSAVYIGDVEFESEGLRIQAERLEVRRAGDDTYDLHATGNPAVFRHAATAEQPAVAASAGEVRYIAAARRLSLIGNVSLERGQDRLTGEMLNYDVDTRRIAVSGGDGGRVRMTIQPQQPPDAPPPQSPAADEAAP